MKQWDRVMSTSIFIFFRSRHFLLEDSAKNDQNWKRLSLGVYVCIWKQPDPFETKNNPVTTFFWIYWTWLKIWSIWKVPGQQHGFWGKNHCKQIWQNWCCETNWKKTITYIFGILHGQTCDGGTSYGSGSRALLTEQKAIGIRIIWNGILEKITWYFDGEPDYTPRKPKLKNAKHSQWHFDEYPFYLVLTFAMGGNLAVDQFRNMKYYSVLKCTPDFSEYRIRPVKEYKTKERHGEAFIKLWMYKRWILKESRLFFASNISIKMGPSTGSTSPLMISPCLVAVGGKREHAPASPRVLGHLCLAWGFSGSN